MKIAIKNKTIIISLMIIVTLLLSLLIFQRHKSNILPKGVATSSSSSDNNFNNQRKTSDSPATTLDDGPTKNSSSQSTSYTNPFSVIVTRAGVYNNNLQVGTLIDGTITSGSCNLTVSQDGQKSISATNNVELNGNSYVCPVFNVPLSQFPNYNNWDIDVTVVSNNQSASSNWSSNPINLNEALNE